MAFSIRSSAALVLCVVLAASPEARAEADDEARAKPIAMEGKKAFDSGDFATAIARYEEAYKLKAAPGLLFNLGQCHRKSGDLEKALSYFRRYLETNPPTAQATATEQLVSELEAAQTARADELRVAAARAEADALAKKIQLELTQRELPRPTPITERWWFWAGIAGVVVAGAATATIVATAPKPIMTTFPDINGR
jgi:tetratricopeptide (TPR) repeat protein